MDETRAHGIAERARERHREERRRTLRHFFLFGGGVAATVTVLYLVGLAIVAPPPLEPAAREFARAWNESPEEAVARFRYENAGINLPWLERRLEELSGERTPPIAAADFLEVDTRMILPWFVTFFRSNRFLVFAEARFPLRDRKGIHLVAGFRCGFFGPWKLDDLGCLQE